MSRKRRDAANAGEGMDDAAQLGQSAKPSCGGVSGMMRDASVEDESVAVVGSERQRSRLSRCFAADAFLQKRVDHGYHVNVARQVLGLLKRPVGVLANVSQMHEVD